MKPKTGKYLRNPAPFALTVVNPPKKRKRARRKNPGEQLDFFDKKIAVKAARKSMSAPRPASAGSASGTVRSAKKNHHKRGGPFYYNPAKKSKRSRRKNPLTCKHVIVDSPARKNPARSPRRSYVVKMANGNSFVTEMNATPAEAKRYYLGRSHITEDDRTGKETSTKFISVTPLSSATKNPTMKKSKRSRKRARNPVRSSKRGRSRRHSRNPSRRRGSRRMRNPVAIVSDIFSPENLAVGTGALAGVVGTRWLVNTLLQGDNTGKRMFDLPGITYPTATAPMTAAQFTDKNKIALAIYEAALPAAIGYVLRNQAPRFSRGVMLASVVNLGIALLKQTDIGTKAGLSYGVGAFLPRGARTFIPGVPPMLSGPATSFINNGAPVPSRGMGAVVDRRWAGATVGGQVNPFKPN